MKKFELTRKVQIILATIFVIVVGAIIVGATSNNKASAATKPCGDPNCTGTMTCNNTGVGTHRWDCNVCSYIETGSCSGGSWKHKSGTSVHQKFCWACTWYYTQESCYDNDGDGVCDANCGNTSMHTHSYTKKSYSQNDSTTHNVTLTCSCGATKSGGTEEHNFGTPTDNEDGNHSATCPDCGYTKTEAHTGASHENGGKCTDCGVTYDAHEQSTTVKEYTKTETTHTPIYACTNEGCTETYEGTEEAHTGATHANGGVCTICGQQYETHGQSTTVKEYTKTETTHIPIYACTNEECTEIYEGTEEAHTGATHANGGVCTICGQQYETHGQSTTVKEYTKTETTHIPIYACTNEGCTEIYEGTEEEHTGATHANGGVCTVCGQQYEKHEQSTTVKEYTKTEATHTPIYACTHEECTETYEGTEEAHNYVDGVCTVCGQEEAQEEVPIEITSEKYELDDKYISKIQPETTVSGLKANLETNATEVNIYNRNNELINDTDKIGTGMKVELKNGDQTKTFTIIVKGDTDGDGTAAMLDISVINKYRLNKKTLDEAFLKAGDVTGDGKVDFYDILKINKFRLHKITEL